MASRRAFSPQTICVLAALCAEPSAWRHGYTLAKQTGLKSGTLYPILMRLADRGLVEASWEDEHVPGRPRRHLYRLTADGLAAAATAATPQTTAGREGAGPRGRKPARVAARAAVPWTGCASLPVAAAVLRWCAWLLPGPGARNGSRRSSRKRLRGSCRMRRQLELATVTREPGDGDQQGRPAGDRGTAGRPLGSRAPARWRCARGRAQRLVRAGGYSAVLALTLCKVSVERMRGPGTLGPGAGGLLWTGEVLLLLLMAIFTAVVIMATAQRSPVTTGTLLRGIAAHPAIWLAVPAPQSRCHIARRTGRWRQCCGLPVSPACSPARRLRGGIRRRVDRYCGPGPAAGRRPPARRRSARGTTTARRRRGPQP